MTASVWAFLWAKRPREQQRKYTRQYAEMTGLRRIQHWLDVTLEQVGVLRCMERFAGRSLTILMYHRVLPDEICGSYPLEKLVIPQSVFEQQLAWLRRNCHVTTIRDALSEPRPTNFDSRRQVCLTFDDGYWDNAACAAPLLDQAGLRATFFITTRFVEQREALWFDRAAVYWQGRGPTEVNALVRKVASAEPDGLSTLDAWLTLLKGSEPEIRDKLLSELGTIGDHGGDERLYSAMSIDQVRSLHARGHEIGSHSVTHPILPQLSDEKLRIEIEQSRDVLRGWLDADVDGFCYLNGDHDDRVIRFVRQSGYSYACTTQVGTHAFTGDSCRLRRLGIDLSRVTGGRHRHSEAAFRAELIGFHAFLGREH